MSELTINHVWIAEPDPLVPVAVTLTCQGYEQEVVFLSAAPASDTVTGDGVCAIAPNLFDSGVETVSDCEEYVNLTQDATCNFQSIQFDQSVPMLSAWGLSMLVVSMALVAAWFMRK